MSALPVCLNLHRWQDKGETLLTLGVEAVSTPEFEPDVANIGAVKNELGALDVKTPAAV